MIDLAFVESLIKALDESSLDNLELERGGTRIHLSKSPTAGSSVAPAQWAGPAAPVFSGGHSPSELEVAAAGAVVPASLEEEEGGFESDLLEITSPMVGTFYASPSPDAPPYVEVGQRVGNGTVLCIIEAMKLMNEMECEVEGTIAKVLVGNAQPVEYGQVLFLIDPS